MKPTIGVYDRFGVNISPHWNFVSSRWGVAVALIINVLSLGFYWVFFYGWQCLKGDRDNLCRSFGTYWRWKAWLVFASPTTAVFAGWKLCLSGLEAAPETSMYWISCAWCVGRNLLSRITRVSGSVNPSRSHATYKVCPCVLQLHLTGVLLRGTWRQGVSCAGTGISC